MNKQEQRIQNILDIDISKLVEECQRGNMSAFEKIYNIHKMKMYNIAFRMHGNEDDASDSLQEAFIKVYKNIKNYRFESAFSTWFYRILVNTCLDNIDKNKTNRRQDLESIENIPDQAINNEMISEVIEKEIKNLPRMYRTVFILYEIEGFNHQEISGILSISIGTSKSNLHRAKEILKSKLKPHFE
jgi:RNA polymerase sigma-70 factor (ECF subfamily)